MSKAARIPMLKIVRIEMYNIFCEGKMVIPFDEYRCMEDLVLSKYEMVRTILIGMYGLDTLEYGSDVFYFKPERDCEIFISFYVAETFFIAKRRFSCSTETSRVSVRVFTSEGQKVALDRTYSGFLEHLRKNYIDIESMIKFFLL